jgi:hypothetical protein
MQADININLYKKLDTLLDAIQDNIKSLIQMHKSLLDESNKKTLPYEYTVYIDDLYFQRNLLCKELDHLLIIKQMSLRRFYANLFRLYQHITSKYVITLKSRRVGSFGTPEHMRLFYEEPRIRIYNEIDIISVYRYADIENIIVYIRHYVDMIKKQMASMINEITDLQRKSDKGFHLISVLWAYQNERSKLDCDIMTFQQIFDAIIVANEYLVRRFISRATDLKNEISDTHSKSAFTLDTATTGTSSNSSYIHGAAPQITMDVTKDTGLKSLPPVTVETVSNDIEDTISSASRNSQDNHDKKSVVDAMTKLIEENTNSPSEPTTPQINGTEEDDDNRIQFEPLYSSDSSDNED